MGNQKSYSEYGSTFDNTLVSSDIWSLKIINVKPKKITHVRVFVADYIVGFEWFYDSVSAGKRTGMEFPQEAEARDIVFEPTEYLAKITGTSFEVIDTLTFHTTYGNIYTVGTYRHGKSFCLFKPDWIIKSFTVGFGRYMHKIGAFFGKRPTTRARAQIQYQNINQMPFQRPVSAPAPHMVHQPHISPTPTQLAPSNYYRPNLNNPNMPTTEASHSQSILNRSNTLPPLNMGSRMHAMHHSYMPQSDSDSEEEKAVPLMHHTKSAEKFNEQAVYFDDYQRLLKDKKNVAMKQLRVIHDGHSVFGVQGVYIIDGQIVEGQIHCRIPLPKTIKNEAIELSAEDRIASIDCKTNKIVKHMKVCTSSGKVYNFGNRYISQVGCQSFNVTVPRGKKCVAIAGYLTTHLQSIACYFI
jgi:hypothetical protein